MSDALHEAPQPIDCLLADLGTLVRRARNDTLTEADYRLLDRRMRLTLQGTGADPDGIILARFDLIARATDDGTLTRSQFEEVASSIRDRLRRYRDRLLPVVPNFAVLPSGVHGRRIGFLTVIDGGAEAHPETTLRGA